MIRELARRLAAREISSVELAQDCLDRIAAANPTLNAFIGLDPERTLAQARAADERIARGHGGPLTGIPIAHKDLFCARGWKTTCGSKMLADFVAPYDATVIERFHAAGAVLLGKTNMDEFAMGSSNENSAFGPVRNPWDLSAVPGGSSGGSAAAVAARLAPAATGTDTGGSIRQPAAFSGVCGLKPTYGRVSRYGMVAFASSLDQGGPIATSAEDLALLLEVMAGFDPRDSTSIDRPAESYSQGLGDSPHLGTVPTLGQSPLGDSPHFGTVPTSGQSPLRDSPLRIGLPKEYFTEHLARDVADPILAAVEQFRKLGAQVVEVSLPNQHLAVPVYYVLAPAEASSNLSRYDGVRYGHRAADYTDLADMYSRSRAEGFGAEVKRRILVGTYVLSRGYYDAYYLQAQRVRRLIARDFAEAFKQCDLILGPAAPSVAYDLGAKTSDPVQMYLDDLYTIPINLAGLPGMSIPCGFGARGRPVGLQIVGNYWDEARMLAAAHAYQQVTDWHQRKPSGSDPELGSDPESGSDPKRGPR